MTEQPTLTPRHRGDARFMHVKDVHQSFVDNLNHEDRVQYDLCRNMTTHDGFPGRSLVLHYPQDGGQYIVDVLRILDFQCDHKLGPSFEVRSAFFCENDVVGCKPQRMFGYGLFMWLPLHTKLRWDATPDQAGQPREFSLAFNVVVRSRGSDGIECTPYKEFFAKHPGTFNPF